MKKLIALLLCCMMLVPAALATQEVEENPPLSLAEIERFTDSLLSQAKNENCEIATDDLGRAVAIATCGDITLSNNALSEESHVLNARLSVGQACLRGLKVGDSQEMIFQVYPNDNPTLLGNYYEATLCIFDQQPEACLGYALREGQRVSEITYVVYNWQQDGVVKSGVTYKMDQGYIQQIDVFITPDMLTEEEALADINDSAMVQEDTQYQAFPTSEIGTDLDTFCREDLSFSGIDFYTLTPDAAVTAFGSAVVDEWVEDSDGSFLRLMQWEGISLVTKYDAGKNFISVYSLSINNESMEGPRGVRVGDYTDTVLFRFRHSEGSAVEDGVLLYGDGKTAPYGKITYSEETNNISYTVALDDDVALLYLTFRNDSLQEIQLFLNK